MHLRSNHAPWATVRPPVSAAGAYQPVSFWQETISVAPGPPLDGETDCDVVIIGGGYTGLSTAHELKRAAPSLDIVLLEHSVVGHGASGRNGGFVMPLLGWDLTDAAHKLGDQAAQAAYRLMYDAVAHTRRVVDENKIDCDLEASGYLILATCTAREQALRDEAALAHRLGFDHRWFDGDALVEHIRSEAFRGGVFDPHPLMLNPAKLARGLKGVVERLGVRVYEQTPLEELRDGETLTARTPRGGVRARVAVLATNGYSVALGFMPHQIIPAHTYIVLTEPLSDAQLDSIGWRTRRTSLETARNLIHYFRLTADNRVAFGGEDAKLYRRGAYRDTDCPTFARLEARFREFFPSLAAVRFTHGWGGVLGVTLDMFPSFGVGGDHASIFHACGYSGHGVSLSNYAGRILAPRILARLNSSTQSGDGPTPFFYGRWPTWLPPDPLRYLGLQLYRVLLQAGDWWQGA